MINPLMFTTLHLESEKVLLNLLKQVALFPNQRRKLFNEKEDTCISSCILYRVFQTLSIYENVCHLSLRIDWTNYKLSNQKVCSYAG